MRTLICLSAGNGFAGSAIRFLTGSNVNHAFIAFYDKNWLGWQAVQIDERGVVIVPAESVSCKSVICYEYKNDLSHALPSIRNLLGHRYDFLGILGFLCKLLVWRIFRKKILNPIHRTGELFCSETVATFLGNASVPWAKELDPPSTSPGNLEDMLDNDTNFQTCPTPWRIF